MASKRQTMDQQRAAQAWQDVTGINEHLGDSGKRKYHSLARSTPAMVQANGLGQTLAFLRAKAGRDRQDEHWLLYAHVSDWVMGQLSKNGDDPGPDRLLEWVVQQDTAVYRRATTETMAYLLWLKRFAEAVLPQATANEE